MSTATRGRGWARGRDPESTSGPGLLRRPGQPLPQQQEPRSPVETEAPKSQILEGAAVGGDNDSNDICQRMENLVLKETECTVKMLDNFAAEIRGTLVKEEVLRRTFEKLHKRAKEDRSIGIKLATVLADLRISELRILDRTMTLQFILLQALQEDYDNREEIRKLSEEQFLNNVSLLGQYYYRARSSLKNPFRVLGLPALEYLSMLLEMPSMESFELLGTLVSINGKTLEKAHPAELEKLVTRVREALLNRKLDLRCKSILLYIIEAANRSFDPPSSEQRQFYLNQLGPSTLARLEGKEEKDISEIIPNSEKNTQFEDAVERNTVGGSVPRAIRGSGANEQSHPKNHQKNEKFTRRPPGSSSRNNNHSSHWGHDDRFSKDYD